MKNMEIFTSKEFGEIRIIEENGKYLFCGADVAAALGYTNTKDALRRHCLEDGVAFHDLIDSIGRRRWESGRGQQKTGTDGRKSNVQKALYSGDFIGQKRRRQSVYT